MSLVDTPRIDDHLEAEDEPDRGGECHAVLVPEPDKFSGMHDSSVKLKRERIPASPSGDCVVDARSLASLWLGVALQQMTLSVGGI